MPEAVLDPQTYTTSTVETMDLDKMDKEIENELKANVTVALETELLKKLIGKVERSVAKKAVQDIFKFVYMKFEEDKITLRGINNDYMTEVVAYQNESQTNFKITEGKACDVCFPADKLVPIVKRLSAKNSSFTIKANVAVIKSGRPKFNLIGVDGSEFPSVPKLGDSLANVAIHPNVLSMIYDRTSYAASTKESRPILTGVHHELSGNRLNCVATDAHRVAQYAYDLDVSYSELTSTIPVAVINEAKKHLDATEKEVNIHFYENQVVYEYEDTTLYGRVLEGNYPVIANLIFDSEQAGTKFNVQAGNFKNLLNNSTVYNSDQPIIIRALAELNQLRVNTREADVGEFQEDLSLTNGEGGDVAIAVNVRYLQDAFSRYNNEDYVTLEFMPTTETKPAGMQPFKTLLSGGNPDCLELFVPVRTSQVDYKKPVAIPDFQGIVEFDFNPFNTDFAEAEEATE